MRYRLAFGVLIVGSLLFAAPSHGDDAGNGCDGPIFGSGLVCTLNAQSEPIQGVPSMSHTEPVAGGTVPACVGSLGVKHVRGNGSVTVRTPGTTPGSYVTPSFEFIVRANPPLAGFTDFDLGGPSGVTPIMPDVNPSVPLGTLQPCP